MADPFRTTRMVEFHDTDMAGIMHFASFFVYMESVEHELLRSLGYSVLAEVDGQHVSFPRVSASCDYASPARCENVMDVAVSVERIGTTSLTYEFHFSHKSRHVATGRMTCVCCEIYPDRPPKPRPVPADLAEQLRTYATTA